MYIPIYHICLKTPTFILFPSQSLMCPPKCQSKNFAVVFAIRCGMQSQKPQHNKIFRSSWWEIQWKILKMKCTINATFGQKVQTLAQQHSTHRNRRQWRQSNIVYMYIWIYMRVFSQRTTPAQHVKLKCHINLCGKFH